MKNAKFYQFVFDNGTREVYRNFFSLLHL